MRERQEKSDASNDASNETGPQPTIVDGGSTASELDVVAPVGVAAPGADGAGEDMANQEQPSPRRRRRTTYRSRKRTNNAEAGNAAPKSEDAPAAVPVSMPDAPQPVVADD